MMTMSPGLGVVRGRAVDADDARAGRPLERVGLEPAAVGAVPDVNLLVRQDVGGAHQRRVDGDRAFVVEVGLRDGGAVNLRLEEGPTHCAPSVQADVAVPAWFSDQGYEARRGKSKRRPQARSERASQRLTARRRIPHADQGVKARNFVHVLGIDLGGGKGKKTALATLARRRRGRDRRRHRAARRARCRSTTPRSSRRSAQYGDETLLCIDAPLTLPPCLRCAVPVCPGQERLRRPVGGRDARARPPRRRSRAERSRQPGAASRPITPYTQRATEVYLAHRLGIVPREGLGQGTGPLAARAAHLVRALADRFTLNENLIEVYPKGTLAALGLRRRRSRSTCASARRARASSRRCRRELRFGPGVWRELCIQSDHLFEAVICAFTGFLWARDGWALPGRGPAARRRRRACATAGSGRRRRAPPSRVRREG